MTTACVPSNHSATTVTPRSFLQRFLIESVDIRGTIVRIEDSWQKILENRNYPFAVTQLLGEFCVISSILSGNLKDPARISLQLQGNAPLKFLLADCNQQLNIRAMATLEDTLPEALSQTQLLDQGQLQLTLYPKHSSQSYTSIVPLQMEGLATSFAHYLTQSEQLVSDAFLCADETTAAGLFLQKLPTSDQKDSDGWSRIHTLAKTVKDDELKQLSPEILLKRLFAEEDIRLFEQRPILHNWPQDRQKVLNMLLNLPFEELNQIIAEQREITISDELSNHHYTFTIEQLIQLRDEKEKNTEKN